MYKYLVVTTLIIFSCSARAHDAVFYCVYQNDDCVDAPEAIAVTDSELLVLAQDILSEKENFIGFIDEDDTTLQFFVDDMNNILIEIPKVNEQGSYGRQLNNQEFLDLLQQITPPYIRYQDQLNLKFLAW